MKKLTKKSKPIFWVHGNQRECRITWEKIVKQIEEKYSESPNIIRMFCGFNPVGATSQRWSTTNDVIDLLRSRDMFDSRPRIIKLIGLPEGYTSLSDWIKLTNDKNVLVLYGPPGYIKPRTKQWVTAKTSKLYKTIKSNGTLCEHGMEASGQSGALRWINAVCEEEGKQIKDDAAKLLFSYLGKNLDILASGVQKLTIYSSSKAISEDDVKACYSAKFGDDVWSYLSDLDRGRIDSALKYLHDFYLEGEGVVGETFLGRVQKFFGAIIQHFLFIMLVKDACPRELNMKSVEALSKSFKKTTPTKIKSIIKGEMNYEDLDDRFSSQYIYRQMHNLPPEILSRRKSEIYVMLYEIYRTMYQCRIRGSNKAYVRLCLDVMSLVICGKITPKQAAIIRGDRKSLKV